MERIEHNRRDKTPIRTICETGRYGDRIVPLTAGEIRSVYRMDCPDGSGTMVTYQILPGVELIFNRFQSFCCMEGSEAFENAPEMLEINHCKSGSFRTVMGDGFCAALSEGDMAANLWNASHGASLFPGGYYYGLEILIDLKTAEREHGHLFRTFGIDLEMIRERLRRHHNGTGFRTTPEVDAVLDVLYRTREDKAIGLLRLKLCELLALMMDLPFDRLPDTAAYLSGERRKAILSVGTWLQEHPESKETAETLSTRFGLSPSALKTGFPAIFGAPLYAWRKRMRIAYAQSLLSKEKYSVSEVAALCGYVNVSKFSEAFKRQTGVTPSFYQTFRSSADGLE